MMTRRSFFGHVAAAAGATGVSTLSMAAGTGENLAVPKQIKAFCIDFNWFHVDQPNKAQNAQAEEESNFFAPPGHWADASPEEHVRWYEELGRQRDSDVCGFVQRLRLVQRRRRARRSRD